MNIAIKGHETRGAEVIEILEMLGGKNTTDLQGEYDNMIYIINSSYYGEIIYMLHRTDGYVVFTLEEFLEKFPYKVGDRVRVPEYESEVRISEMYWDGSEVQYEVVTDETEWYSAKELNEFNEPYKEETMEEEGVYADNEINCYHQDFGDKVRIRLGGDYEIKVEDRATYIVKKQSQYPKTYKECCEVLRIPKNEHYIDIDAPLVPSNYNKLVSTFTKLLICRDAYWKIVGEEMGLGKPWKPDYHEKSYEQGSPIKYVIYYMGTYITKEQKCTPSYILAFPTAEIRDTFFKNFKELIEICKELL